jgi:hypothetical protein
LPLPCKTLILLSFNSISSPILSIVSTAATPSSIKILFSVYNWSAALALDPMKDVISDYAGLFFHVGEGLAVFNQTWEENSPKPRNKAMCIWKRTNKNKIK